MGMAAGLLASWPGRVVPASTCLNRAVDRVGRKSFRGPLRGPSADASPLQRRVGTRNLKTRRSDRTYRACHNMRMNADKCGLSVDSGYVELAVEVFSMLADATRVRIVLALRDGEMSVNEIAEKVGKPQSAVSQHLAKMRLARMVSTRQEGTRVYYRLENEHARQLVADAIFQAEHSLGGTPPHHHQATADGAA